MIKPKITIKQLEALKTLVKNLNNYQVNGWGKVSEMQFLHHFDTAGHIYLKYENEFVRNGEMGYEYKIIDISPEGISEAVDGKFKTMFDRYNFISECKTFDMNDSNQYEIV
jgi:hypothetical protein